METPRPEKTRKTSTGSLPRPNTSVFCELECLGPKVRSPDSDRYSGSFDDMLMPDRPSKKSTPRTGSSLLFKPENGKFTPHRIPSMENLLRDLSVFQEFFQDCRVLGKGSYGTVYDARYSLNQVRYAVKLFSRKGPATEYEVQQVNLLQQYPHPNCLRYHFAWRDKKFDEFGIVTELCERGSLKMILSARALSEAEIWGFFIDLLQGLHHIHGNGLRHLDVSPENLFVTASGQLRIGDFGLASPLGETHEFGRGTRPYAAPELREDESLALVGTAADIYSAGVILYEMVSDYDVTRDAKHWQAPPQDRQFADLTRFCSLMMHEDAQKRPSAAQILADRVVRKHVQARKQAFKSSEASTNAGHHFPVPDRLVGAVVTQQPSDGPPVKVARNLFQ